MNKLGKLELKLKNGNELLTQNGKSLSSSVLDFWRWSVSDLSSNATRGKFAEFIVATATGVNLSYPRDEWAAYDLITPKGVKIEVKSAAYLQSWEQESLSKIFFSIKPSLFGDIDTNSENYVKKRQAEMYVFCLLNCVDKSNLNPLEMSQWDFYVVPTRILDDKFNTKSTISLRNLGILTKPVSFSLLNQEIITIITKSIY